MAFFAYETGCHRSEILGLQWKQVGLENSVVIRLEAGETKNGEARTRPLTIQVIHALRYLPRESEFVFTSRGKPIKSVKIRNFSGARVPERVIMAWEMNCMPEIQTEVLVLAREWRFNPSSSAPMMRFVFAALLAAILVQAQSPLVIPDNLKPPASEKLVVTARAEGDQVYTCDGSSWALTGPEAKLFDELGTQIGRHFAGPTWESSDGSRVIGRPVANTTPDPDSIPWLLLAAKDHQGSGVMTNVSSIQRLSTQGGKAPGNGCDSAHKGAVTRSHYTAVYRFYAPH
jgi:hypothetical protein